MTQDIRNPVELPRPLHSAEEEFARCLREGRHCVIGDGNRPESPKESGDDANIIRGEVIRFFSYGGNKTYPVSGPMVQLFGGYIRDEINLQFISTPLAFGFINCYIESRINMLGTECAALNLHGSKLMKKLVADGLKTKNSVYLNRNLSAEDEVRLPNANIGGSLYCEKSEFLHSSNLALNLDQSIVGGNVFLSDNFVANGTVQLSGSRIGGALDCDGGKFKKSDNSEYALLADKIRTNNDIRLGNNFFANGQIDFLGANISGDLICKGGKFHNPNKESIIADRMKVNGSVFLNDGFSSSGEVRLLGVSIDVNLNCESGKFNNSGKVALSTDTSTISGNVNLKNIFAKGEVRLSGSKIDGDLSCVSGKFHNSNGNALVIDSVKIGGNVFLSNGFSAKGEVKLLGACISGDLFCEDGKFHNPTKKALSADRLSVGDTVYFINGFSSEGEVRLSGATIGGNLHCIKSNLCNADGYALIAERAKINGGLSWKNIEQGIGIVNLQYSRATILDDDLNSWKHFKVALHGFSYDYFHVLGDSEFRIKWLQEITNKMGFSPLPYEQAAKVLFKIGRDIDARKVLYAKQQLWTENLTFGYENRVRKIWNAFSGYGYLLGRTNKWIFHIIMLSAMSYWIAAFNGKIVPHQPVVLADPNYQMYIDKGLNPIDAAKEAIPDYPGFNALLYSADVFIPVFSLHQETFWAPHPGSHDFLQLKWLVQQGKDFDCWWLLFIWYWIEIVAGWILTSLLILSLTGLLRPRQASGEKD